MPRSLLSGASIEGRLCPETMRKEARRISFHAVALSAGRASPGKDSRHSTRRQNLCIPMVDSRMTGLPGPCWECGISLRLQPDGFPDPASLFPLRPTGMRRSCPTVPLPFRSIKISLVTLSPHSETKTPLIVFRRTILRDLNHKKLFSVFLITRLFQPNNFEVYIPA